MNDNPPTDQNFYIAVKILATGYDLSELMDMYKDKSIRKGFSLIEIETAIREYNNFFYKDERESTLNINCYGIYEITLLAYDFGDVYPYQSRSLYEYLLQEKLNRISIKEIKKITRIPDF